MNCDGLQLALDCKADLAPGLADHEEWIQVQRDVKFCEVRRLFAAGEFNVPNSLLASLALSRLDQLGINTR
jgi:hypothetical protein